MILNPLHVLHEYNFYNNLLYPLFSDCDNDTFNCASGVDCITMSSVCDGRLDCQDMSDEFGCGRLIKDITVLNM